MKAGLAFLVFLASFLTASGQKKVVDSLHKELTHLRTSGTSEIDSLYINIVNALALGYQRINPDSTLAIAQRSRMLSEKANYAKGLAEALRSIGIVYYLRSDFTAATVNLYEALKVAERIHYQKGIGRIYNNIGLVFYGQAKYDEALDAQFKSLEIKEKINDKEGLATSLNNIANIYKNKGDYTQSLSFHFKSLKVKKEMNDTRAIAASLNNIGWVYLTQHNYKEAQKYFLDAIPLNAIVKDKIIGSDLSQGMAECFLAFGEYQKALASAKESIDIARSINLKDQLRDVNETLFKIYKAQGNHKESLFHFEKFKAYADSINNTEIEKRTSYIVAQHEYEKKEAQLKAEQEVKNKEFEKEKLTQRWVMFFVIAILVFVTVAAFLIFQSRKKLQLAYHRLEIANDELQFQKEEIAMQRDIVADQNQKLNEASQTIAHQNEEIKQQIENLESEVEKRTKELFDYNQQLEQFAFITAHNLRAPVATILGLGNVLEMMPENPAERQLIYDRLIFTTRELDRVVRDLNLILQIRKNNDSVISEVNLEEEFQLMKTGLEKEIRDTQAQLIHDFSNVRTVYGVRPYIYSIFFNLIGNAIKYRHADRTPVINARTELRDKFVCLIIADNGLGIDLGLFKEKIFTLYSRFHNHVEGKGLGLHMVKTQLSAMGGTIDIESKVGQGTTFIIHLPLRGRL